MHVYALTYSRVHGGYTQVGVARALGSGGMRRRTRVGAAHAVTTQPGGDLNVLCVRDQECH